MKKTLLLTLSGLLIISASIVSAGSQADTDNKTQTTKQTNKQHQSSIVVFNNLSLEIDYWHDASLKGDSKKVAEHMRVIHRIISDNINADQKTVTYAKLETSYKQNEESSQSIQIDENKLSVKKLLFSAIKKSSSFAYSYRLLADYQHLLKEEIESTKIQIAGDNAAVDDNTGKARFLK